MTLENFFKLLSDETRIRIVMLLNEKDLCVTELMSIMGITQPNVSKHLTRLRDSNIVKYNKQEQYVFYSLNKEKLLSDIINNLNANIDKHKVLKIDKMRLKKLTT